MADDTPFSFYNQFDSLSLQQQRQQQQQQQHSFPPSDAFSFQFSQQSDPSVSQRKRKSSNDDISPLAMKTRTGIGLEQEIVYDRTWTMMTQGQRRLLEEQRQRELQAEQQQQQQQQQMQQQKETPADAMKRLFMAGKSHDSAQHSQNVTHHPGATIARAWTFDDCAGEVNGCETNRIPGMRERYQAVIGPCSFCQRLQCQFCTVHCTSCQEMLCRACCVTSYDKNDNEYYCFGCQG